MSSSCQVLLNALKDCLLHSDCVVKQGHLPSECLKEHYNELPEQCRHLRQATYECKRGMVRTCLGSASRNGIHAILMRAAGYEEEV
jgi:hypothetical protein